MKKLMTLALAAGMLLGAATGASAIDFKAKGQWLMGFAAGDGALVSHKKADKASNHNKAADTDDTFSAMQRLRLQLDAVASESLSGTVYFEIGDTTWGQNASGGALGADSNSVVELKNAYTGDFITLYGVSEAQVRLLGTPYTALRGAYRIEVPDTAAATSLILAHPEIFTDYEITKGRMDDVFLAATGKKVGEDAL